MNTHTLYRLFMSFLVILAFTTKEKLNAQTDIIDSLHQALKTSTNSVDSADVYFNLSLKLSRTYSDSGFIYARKSMSLIDSAENKMLWAKNLSQLGHSHYMQNHLDSSLYYWDLTARLYEQEDDLVHSALMHENLGVQYAFKGEFEKSLHHLEKAKEQYEIIDTILQHQISVNYGLLYDLKGDYEIAFDYYMQAYQFADSTQNQYRLGLVANNICAMYFYMEDYSKSITYGQLALQNWADDKYKSFRDEVYLDLAVSYEAIGSVDSAILYNNLALEVVKDNKDKWSQGKILHNLGCLYIENGNKTIGLQNLQEAKLLKDNFEPREGSSSTYLELARVYLSQNQIASASKLYNRAEEIATAVGITEEIKSCYQFAVELYESKSMYQRANRYLHQYTEIKDSLLNKEIHKNVEEIKTKYEVEKTSLENQILQAENTATRATITNQRYFLGLTGLGVLTLGLLSFFYRERKKQAEELKILKEEEARFLKEENDRLVESNQGLAVTLSKLKDNPAAILNENWVINPKGKNPIQSKLGDILAISTSTDKANVLEYIIADSDFRPPERRSMKNLIADPNYPKDVFQRVHQSHIVNIYNITSIDPIARKVFLKGMEDPIHISADYIEPLTTAYASCKK